MEGFPSNSRIPKQKPVEEPPAKKVEKVVDGGVIRRKKPWQKRWAENISSSGRNAGVFVLYQVLLPAVKDMLADSATQGIEQMLFRESRSAHRRSRGRGPDNNFTNYNRTRYNQNRRPDDREPRRGRASRSSYDLDEIILDTRVEAEDVIEKLFELLSKYEVATVADLYDLVGEPGNFTDHKWGWTDLRGSGVTWVNSGYLLDLPRPEPIE